MGQERPQNGQPPEGERIAKVIARAGLCSRREAEAWIGQGRVAVNGEVIGSPARNVGAHDRVTVDGQPLPARERTRLFLYHKPAGLLTTRADPQGRPTIFTALPPELPRLISVGRLDLNTEGLLLLTNDGGLARVLELPATGWLRRYRVRAHGRIGQDALDRLRHGVTIDGVHYGSIEAKLERAQGSNVWLLFAIREGKNREVKNVLSHLGLAVNRLIRVSFGPFRLGDLAEGAVEEVRTRTLREQLGPRVAALAGADFSAPVEDRARIARRGGRHPSPALPFAGRPPELRAREAAEPRRAAAKTGRPRPPSFEARLRRAPQDDGTEAVRRRRKPPSFEASVRRAPQDDGTQAVRRGPKRRRDEAERLGQPELARREKRRARRSHRNDAPFGGGKSGGDKSRGGRKPPRGKGR